MSISKSGCIVKKYPSVTEAAKDVGGQESHISECINNVTHRNTHKGYIWRYDYGAVGTAKN